MPPKTLFHWSKKPLNIFLKNEPRFEVHTQGRAWVIDKISKAKGATSRVPAVSLVVFREQATELFVKYPVFSFLVWKRFFGQYWSKDIYQDIVWNASDAFQCGRVLVVRKAKFVDIDDLKRLENQITKRRRFIAAELMGAFLVLVLIISAALAYDFLPSGVRDWLFARMPDVSEQDSAAIGRIGIYFLIGAVAAMPIIIHFMKIVRRPNPDGTKWEVEAEVKCAMEKADKAQAAEELRKSQQ